MDSKDDFPAGRETKGKVSVLDGRGHARQRRHRLPEVLGKAGR